MRSLEFIDENGGGPGVRLKTRQQKIGHIAAAAQAHIQTQRGKWMHL
jgi:hypothetical protein